MNKELIVPGITDKTELLVISRARTYQQYCRAVENTLRGGCPFCQTETMLLRSIRKTGPFWVISCDPPEPHTRFHFLIIPRRHIVSLLELNGAEWLLFGDCLRELRDDYDLDATGILIRDGDARKLCGTITHLHVQVMVPNGTGRVASPFAKTSAEEREAIQRAIVFEKLRQVATPRDLSPEEYLLVEGRLS